MSNFKTLSTGLVAIALSLAAGYTATAQSNQNTSPIPPAQPVQRTENPPRTTSPTGSRQNTLSPSDKKFIIDAAQGGLAEVQLGQLASQRGSSDAVKQFAQRMIDDHTPVNSQLQQLATEKGVTLPTTIGSKNQQLKQHLSKLSGTNFDREYMTHMLQDHQKDVSAFQREAQQGKNPDVKAFAAQTLPTLQEHLQQARSIVNPGTSTSTPNPTNKP